MDGLDAINAAIGKNCLMFRRTRAFFGLLGTKTTPVWGIMQREVTKRGWLYRHPVFENGSLEIFMLSYFQITQEGYFFGAYSGMIIDLFFSTLGKNDEKFLHSAYAPHMGYLGLTPGMPMSKVFSTLEKRGWENISSSVSDLISSRNTEYELAFEIHYFQLKHT